MDGDFAIVWDAERTQGDWQLGDHGALLTAPALETAVMVSLFTDARARPGDTLPAGTTDRRGWWGSALDNEPVGSRLWLLRRAKREPETLRRAREFIIEALAWLTEDQVATRVDVETEWRSPTSMGASIVIHQGEGRQAALRAEWAWQGI
ncbi:phage GP46 family protein [Roseomonas xinghualingensis]|uniref:phage GP46 family protein n=1 Tax=Roseomonas xinghualingensis TaxID=2986475 RepID=UPI0021F0B2BC|nr:phage GP46 family protein [Roseomonas sp. SXEYE001]MCV4206927.1 phage GP46 family protein [Roseomonas sp. SXEYE001]